LACSIAAVFSTSCIEVVCDGETFEPLLQPFDVSLNYVRFDRGLVAMGSLFVIYLEEIAVLNRFQSIPLPYLLALKAEKVRLADVKLGLAAIELECLLKVFVTVSSRRVVFGELEKRFSSVTKIPRVDRMVITADELQPIVF